MARDKLITIRIEESKRDAFREWAKNNQVDGATFLYRIIEQCIDNKLSTDIVNPNIAPQKSTLIDIQTNIHQLSEKFKQTTIDQNSKLATLQSEIDDLKNQLSIQTAQKHKPKKTNNQSKSTRKISKRVDNPNQEDNLLSDQQLAEILGVSRPTVNRWRTGQRKPSDKHQDLFDHYEVIENKWRKI